LGGERENEMAFAMLACGMTIMYYSIILFILL